MNSEDVNENDNERKIRMKELPQRCDKKELDELVWGYYVKDDMVYELKAVKNEEKKAQNGLSLISDGWAVISEQTRKENGESIYKIVGKGASDGHEFSFAIDAGEFSEDRTLKKRLERHFGGRNKVSGLTGDIIKDLSIDIKEYKLIETPSWIDGKVALKGLDLIPDVRYTTNSRVPVDVSCGDLEKAQKGMKDLLISWDKDLTTVGFVTTLGSPLIARFFPGDRFGLMIEGLTGCGKTEFIKLLLGIYGKGYLNEEILMRWGAGATPNALMKVGATSGFLPFLVDNYKPIKPEHPAELVGLIQAVLEGSDKLRLSSDSELKDSAKFACTLIITGEDFPVESSTMARCIILAWQKISNTESLTNAQNLADNFPALGRAWLTWLSDEKNTKIIDDEIKKFGDIRHGYFNEIDKSNGINAGRISTNLALLEVIWQIALKCPALTFLSEFNTNFESSIKNLLVNGSKEIVAANESEIFVNGLNQLIASGKAKLAPNDQTMPNYTRDVVGWIRKDENDKTEVCIFPDIARTLVKTVSPTMQNVSPQTLYKQLEKRGYIKINENNGERTLIRKFNKKNTRVLVFKCGISLMEEAMGKETPVT